MRKLLLLTSCLLLLAACGPSQSQDRPIVVLETNHGQIHIELYTDLMPITAGNFKDLVEQGYYDDVIFHRIIPGFMIQGGDPTGTGRGGPGYTIDDEFVEHERLTNTRGSLSMANAGPDTGGSQFFINLVDNTRLDWDKPPQSSQHAVFGRIIQGMDVVDAMANVETGPQDRPAEDVIIQRAYVR